MSSCYCTGPRKGEPFCPCEMQRRNIKIKDGHWVEPEKNHGEVFNDIFPIIDVEDE